MSAAFPGDDSFARMVNRARGGDPRSIEHLLIWMHQEMRALGMAALSGVPLPVADRLAGLASEINERRFFVSGFADGTAYRDAQAKRRTRKARK